MEVHRSRKTEATTGRTLHLDLAGPYDISELNAARYLLVAAYRGVDKGGAALPVLPFVCPLPGKHSIDVTAAVEDILRQIEALNCPWLQDGQRVVRVHSDRGSEFVNSTLRQALQSRKIHQTLTRGYNPQANGTAESAVKQMKAMIRRLLVHAALDLRWWAYAALHACEVLRTKWLQRKWTYPSFGDHVVARLVHKDPSGLVPKGSIGKLLLFRATGDKSSELLVGDEVVRGGLPVCVKDIPSSEERTVDGSTEPDVASAIQAQWDKVLSPGGKPLWLNKSTKVIQTTEPHVILPVDGPCEVDPEQRPLMLSL